MKCPTCSHPRMRKLDTSTLYCVRDYWCVRCGTLMRITNGVTRKVSVPSPRLLRRIYAKADRGVLRRRG